MAKKKFINQLYRKNKSSRVTSKMLQEQSVNAILTDPENRTLWINGNPYGNAYIDRADNNYDNLSTSNNYEEIGTIHGEIFNDFDNNEAKGDYSHAEGLNTRTKNLGEHAEGKYNYSVEGSTISTIGIGTSDDKRKNAMRVDNDGSVYLSEIKQQLPDGRRITHDPCNYDGTEKKEDTRSLQEILAGLGNMINVTYGELRTLIDNKKLIPGMQYRITDYGSTGNNYIVEYNTDYQFDGNQFDIIVVADDIDTLNIEGRACEHDFDNDIKILAENIINNEKDTINNDLSEEQKNDPTFFVSYENFKIYSETQNNVIKNSYYDETKQLYDKILNQTSEIDKKKKYFTDYNTDFSKWKLKYDINSNNSYYWVNNNYEDKHILVNVSINDGNNGTKYEIREYHFDSNIDYTPGDSDITYKYKWRLTRYQKVNSQSVTNFLENDDENKIITVKKPSLDEIIPEEYNNVLLTELKYPTSDYTGSLLFCKDSSLYNLYIDNETSKKDYLMEDILLVEIYNDLKSEYTYFLYSGTIFYDNKLVHKWVESTSNTYEKFITGTPNIVNNNYLAENWNTQIRNDSNGDYYRYILSETLTPFYIEHSDENKQKYITNDSIQTPSFINDSYFKEYIVEPDKIDKSGMYIVGTCGQSNENLAFDGITIFKKEDKNSNEYKIHYNLTEEIYSYTQNNTTKYYNVWYINNISNTNDIIPNRILTGGYDSDKNALEYIEKLKSTEINDLDKLQYLKDELYNNIEWYQTLLDNGTNTNINQQKFYEYSATYEIKTTVFNTIKFNFANSELINIKQVINNDYYDSNSLTENIPINTSDYKLFNFYYDTYETDNYQGINLNIYKNNNNNDENFVIGVNENNNVFIYYNYIQDDKIIQDKITKEYYNYFNFVDNKYFAQGVIIYLCDEFNNECEYDFKNIKFYHKIEYGYKDLYKIENGSLKNNPSHAINETPKYLKYFYTFSSFKNNYLYDNSLKQDFQTENNNLKNKEGIKQNGLNKNIFINCELLNNIFYNVLIILSESKLLNNNFYNVDNLNNKFWFKLDYGDFLQTYYPITCECNTFKNCSNININHISGGGVGTFDIINNDLFEYKNKNIFDNLTSSILYNNDSSANIGDKNNTKIDIPNIKTKNSSYQKLLYIDYDNVNIHETESNKKEVYFNNHYIKCYNELDFKDLPDLKENQSSASTVYDSVSKQYSIEIDNDKRNFYSVYYADYMQANGKKYVIQGLPDKMGMGVNPFSSFNSWFETSCKNNFSNMINNNSDIKEHALSFMNNGKVTLTSDGYFTTSNLTYTNETINILDINISEDSQIYKDINNKYISNKSKIQDIIYLNDLTFNTIDIKNKLSNIKNELENTSDYIKEPENIILSIKDLPWNDGIAYKIQNNTFNIMSWTNENIYGFFKKDSSKEIINNLIYLYKSICPTLMLTFNGKIYQNITNNFSINYNFNYKYTFTLNIDYYDDNDNKNLKSIEEIVELDTSNQKETSSVAYDSDGITNKSYNMFMLFCPFINETTTSNYGKDDTSFLFGINKIFFIIYNLIKDKKVQKIKLNLNITSNDENCILIPLKNEKPYFNKYMYVSPLNIINSNYIDFNNRSYDEGYKDDNKIRYKIFGKSVFLYFTLNEKYNSGQYTGTFDLNDGNYEIKSDSGIYVSSPGSVTVNQNSSANNTRAPIYFSPIRCIPNTKELNDNYQFIKLLDINNKYYIYNYIYSTDNAYNILFKTLILNFYNQYYKKIDKNNEYRLYKEINESDSETKQYGLFSFEYLKNIYDFLIENQNIEDQKIIDEFIDKFWKKTAFNSQYNINFNYVLKSIDESNTNGTIDSIKKEKLNNIYLCKDSLNIVKPTINSEDKIVLPYLRFLISDGKDDKDDNKYKYLIELRKMDDYNNLTQPQQIDLDKLSQLDLDKLLSTYKKQ
jgi:hypothetical protein